MKYENISCLKFLLNLNISYDIRLSHTSKIMYLWWCRSAGKFRKARSVRGSILAAIRVIALKYSLVFDKGKFEKNGLLVIMFSHVYKTALALFRTCNAFLRE